MVEPLTTLCQRVTLLERHRLDAVLVLQASPALLELSAETFWQRLLLRDLQIQGIVEGGNFCFGKDRRGTIELLKLWCEQAQLPCEVVGDVYRYGMRISSSEIRQALKRGDIRAATRALGRPYSITGKVVHGDHRGRTIGFPTCNLAEIATLIPHDGVYAALARIKSRDLVCQAAVNLGPNPTFGGTARKVEAHLLSYTGDLYDQEMTLELIARLRDTRKFAGIDELKQQLHRDVEETKSLFSQQYQRGRHGQA